MKNCAFKTVQVTKRAAVFLGLSYTSRLAMTAAIAWASRGGGSFQSGTYDANQLLCSFDTEILGLRLSAHLIVHQDLSSANLCSSLGGTMLTMFPVAEWALTSHCG
jgi:hypothetical protein